MTPECKQASAPVYVNCTVHESPNFLHSVTLNIAAGQEWKVCSITFCYDAESYVVIIIRLNDVTSIATHYRHGEKKALIPSGGDDRKRLWFWRFAVCIIRHTCNPKTYFLILSICTAILGHTVSTKLCAHPERSWSWSSSSSSFLRCPQSCLWLFRHFWGCSQNKQKVFF